ncbi:hypothetical protein [Burkholderia ubonensis]|uniref:hypothetical protein n=1 Tax=Burkholderia ubonensis TaxID=101571 RepID=UPI000A9C10B0|nr:hypothetical protein [Burkholderia ubonensis]
MTNDQIIALAASIAACVSGIAGAISGFAALRTNKEMVRQRQASYQPELAFSRVVFEACSDPVIETALPLLWISGSKQQSPDNSGTAKPPKTKLTLPLSNVGLGAARDVQITWSFALDQAIERLNDAAKITKTPMSIRQENQIVHIDSGPFGKFSSMWRNQQKLSLNFLMPLTESDEATPIEIPHTYIAICCIELFLATKQASQPKLGKTLSLDLPNLVADIRYSDIGGSTHHRTFEFTIDIVAVAGDAKIFTGFINCRNRHVAK